MAEAKWTRDPISVVHMESKNENFPNDRVGLFCDVPDTGIFDSFLTEDGAEAALKFAQSFAEAVLDIRKNHVARYISKDFDLKKRNYTPEEVAEQMQRTAQATAETQLTTIAAALGISVEDLKAKAQESVTQVTDEELPVG